MTRPLEPNDSALLGGDRHEETTEDRGAPFYEAGWKAGRNSRDLDAWEPNHRPSLRRGLAILATVLVIGLALGFAAGRALA